MTGLAVLFCLPPLAYCLAQAVRDVRRRDWGWAIWGGATALFLGWIIERLTSGPSY